MPQQTRPEPSKLGAYFQVVTSIFYSFTETDIFENWYPGTVTAAEGYQLLKTMLTKSMMNDKDLEAFARFIHCKLNY